jgi:hypothetical protein
MPIRMIAIPPLRNDTLNPGISSRGDQNLPDISKGSTAWKHKVAEYERAKEVK